MKKAFDQTVREIKREVNKKVLKVPGIEQKVLDATSNEPWGPHGSLLADIAQASRNYHEYQMIMQIIWKRINDTGKNWRHVYKGLTVLEYMVAHGSERVIDEIREHAYQISTLSDFQYIDSNGKDQGNNVRKKSQSLVVLVNDKERIQEARQKAAANRDKFRNTSMGGMYRPGSGGYGYDDDRYGGRDDDQNGYGREREWVDDRYGRDGDRQSRDSEERYGRDDDYRGRSQSVDGYRYNSRSRSSDRERGRSFEDDGQYSSRGSGAKADDRSQDGSFPGKPLDRKSSEQNLGAPPSYEDAVGEAQSPVRSERGEVPATTVPKAPAPVSTSPSETDATNKVSAPPASASPPPPASLSPPASSPANKEIDSFDEFDPRGSFAVAPTTTSNAEMDLLGSLSDSFSSNPLAIMPATPANAVSEADAPAGFSSGSTFAAASSAPQPFDDPFGDGPFRAVPTTEALPAQPQTVAPTSLFAASSEQPEKSINPYGEVSPMMNESFAPQDFPSANQDTTDILADILPPPGPSAPVTSPTGFPPQPVSMNGYSAQSGPQEPQTSSSLQAPSSYVAQSGFPGQAGAVSGFPGQANSVTQTGFGGPTPQPAQQSTNYYGNYLQQQQAQAAPSMVLQPTPVGPTQQYNNSNFLSHSGHGSFISTAPPQPTVPASTALALVPQPTKDKFETKSTIWADTLNRGLVNLNISGPKTNPLADIGVDFDAINRREKRMEKPTTSSVTSTITMGKAMGSGSGIGRAGAGALRPTANSMMGSGMGMGGGGGYGGGMNQPPMGMNMVGQNMGVRMNMGGANVGMGMNMGMMAQGGAPMQPLGFPPGSNMPGGYNPMMGRGGGYTQQQPYGGGYR